MTVHQARTWLIVMSLSAAAGAFVFFILAPVVGYPLRYAQAMTLLQIVLPVFLGYLGAATQFVFQKGNDAARSIRARPMMELLVKGPVFVFCLMLFATIVAFGFSNRLAAPPGEGMSFETFSAAVTAALGLLAVTTNAVVAYLFSVDQTAKAGGVL